MAEKTKTKVILTEPEWLSRNDTQGGRWLVEECRAVRGEPQTDIVGREMKVPTQNDALARAIRAHEMMHAKVSPAGDWDSWVKRKIASKSSLTVVEELRVNTLCQYAGFDVKSNLADGGESADGERVGATKDWAGAVQMAVATAGTASNKLFLTGVRRHNREWGVILLDISKRAVKEMNKVVKKRGVGELASTQVHENSQLSPRGFSHTERIAEWVDRLCAKSPEDIAKEAEQARQARAKAKADRESANGKGTEGEHSNKGESATGEGKMDGNPYTGITSSDESRTPYWGTLKVERLPMPVHTKGNIGRKRVASNVGMRPRRMHRYLTDPQMRIFDRVVRGSGGVVVLDSSGSMSFSREQLHAILDNCAGATVIMYTDKERDGTNCWIVADKGRMVNELPDVGYGNGVDFPALEFGKTFRQTASSPFIWVTDGGVCGPNQGYSNLLAMQCITFCKRNNVIIVPHADEAIEQLKNLKNGNKAKSDYPEMFVRAYHEMQGTQLQ